MADETQTGGMAGSAAPTTTVQPALPDTGAPNPTATDAPPSAPAAAKADEPKAAVDETTAKEPEPAPEQSGIDRAIETWVRNNILNSPISAITECWNHLHKVIPDLKALLEKEL